MSRPIGEADARLWSIIAATVRPLERKARPPPVSPRSPGPQAGPRAPAPAAARAGPPAPAAPAAARPAPSSPPTRSPPAIEPGRRRRLERGRDQAAAVLDLHGLNQDQARASLTAFLLRQWSDRRRAVLVITGKGALGDGVLRRRVPEWIGEPPLRAIVAGLSDAHRRHGGAGALYVALKRGPAD